MEGAVLMRGPSTFGLPPKEAPGSILRRQVQRRFQVSLLHGQQGRLLYSGARSFAAKVAVAPQRSNQCGQAADYVPCSH